MARDRPKKKFVDIAGKRFGRLIAINISPNDPGVAPNGKLRPWRWVCKCDCGREKEIIGRSLWRGLTKSCGCIQEELLVVNPPRLLHGMRRTREYNTWCKIKHRVVHDHSYTTRGIGIHPDWLHSFETLYEHVGPRPDDHHSLDRIDNSRGYEPGNVRWATRIQQANNKSSNRRLNVSGETLTIAEASRKFGVSASRITARLRRGWSVPMAVKDIDYRYKGAP